MNQTILFSPVGGTDPISLNNYRDGSLLHISRFYKPDKIIMYMSKEILEKHRADDRYRYCLDKLADMQNRTMEYQIIERPDLSKVHEFDEFYRDFREIIDDILRNMDESDQLILNVSSGTPSMKSGLLVLQTLLEYPCILVQVRTPTEKMNDHIHEGFDVEMLWQLNEDNDVNAPNRCKVVECPTLTRIKHEEIIKKHIEVFDYQAALVVAETIPRQLTVECKNLLKLGAARMLLDMNEVDRIQTKYGYNLLPVTEERERAVFEYALNLQVKLHRKEYVDFIRGITPLLVDLMEMLLVNRFAINIKDYCSYNEKKRSYEWSMKKLSGTHILKYLNGRYNGAFRGTDIYSEHLKTIIENVCTDEALKENIKNLRKVERNIRNLAAHQIVAITEKTIKKETGFTACKIMLEIKKLVEYALPNISASAWDSYNEMNALISQNLNNIK